MQLLQINIININSIHMVPQRNLVCHGSPPMFLRIAEIIVKHRLSLVAYPQSNNRTEIVVKTAKRIENVGFIRQWQGSLTLWLPSNPFRIQLVENGLTAAQHCHPTIDEGLLHEEIQKNIPITSTCIRWVIQ